MDKRNKRMGVRKKKAIVVYRERQLMLQLSPSAQATCMFCERNTSLELVEENQQRISLLVKE
eukprot:2921530-Ditylum_brightwellii.AAC.1